MDEQKQLALLAVQAAAEACRTDLKIYENGAYQDCIQAIADAERYLIDAIEGRVIGETPNPAYKNFDLAVTKLVLLSVEFSEVYDLLMANICDGKPLSCYSGFVAIHWFFRLLSDDHSFVLVEDGDKAVIEIRDGYLIGPASFHSYLSKII